MGDDSGLAPESNSDENFHAILMREVEISGFSIAGAVDLDPTLLEKDLRYYDRWIADGFAGAMSYLERGRQRRADPRLVFPAAQSILCVGVPYSARPAGRTDTAEGPRYARYLRNSDYHLTIPARLEEMMQRVKSQWNTSLTWKICVDTSAVLERGWAALAGLGWIGKNSMLIHPRFGSYLFLGEVLISQTTGQRPKPLPSYCGNCTRCLDACPTQAFLEPRLLDSRRCISYLTLEKRGEFEATDTIRKSMSTWVAGCDLCQEVCPFNIKVSKEPLTADDRAISLDQWRDLLLESEAEYRIRVKDSSLNRVKPAQFRRNLANALENILTDPTSVIEPLQRKELLDLIRAKFEKEVDAVAFSGWSRCIAALERLELN